MRYFLPVMDRLDRIGANFGDLPVARRCKPVMAWLDPAIIRGAVLDEMAGSSPAMTLKVTAIFPKPAHPRPDWAMTKRW
jgi:hypothetical protein